MIVIVCTLTAISFLGTFFLWMMANADLQKQKIEETVRGEPVRLSWWTILTFFGVPLWWCAVLIALLVRLATTLHPAIPAISGSG